MAFIPWCLHDRSFPWAVPGHFASSARTRTSSISTSGGGFFSSGISGEARGYESVPGPEAVVRAELAIIAVIALLGAAGSSRSTKRPRSNRTRCTQCSSA